MERLVINVEAQIARDRWEEALAVEQLAKDLLEAGDPAGLKLMQDAEATKRSARVAVARAKSIETGTDPASLEPSTFEPLTDDEIAEREEIAVEAAWGRLREERKGLLAGSDYLVQPDYPLNNVEKAKWSEYRQKLRDLPAETTDPTAVEWPEPPA